jgi:hypothetical protein
MLTTLLIIVDGAICPPSATPYCPVIAVSL